MISGIGTSAMGGMPSMSMMNEMRSRMFSKADGDSSGGLSKTEFTEMAKQMPMAGRLGGDAGEAFGRIDTDSDGNLTQTELDSAAEQMMSRFQSTLEKFGAASGASSVAGPRSENDPVRTLLDALQRQVDAAKPNENTGANAYAQQALERMRISLDAPASSLMTAQA